jgi:hypothetical protein
LRKRTDFFSSLLAQASANCIAFLDADDTWMPERLAYDLGVLDANPSISAVISSTLYWWMDESQPARVDRFNSPLNCVLNRPGFAGGCFV